MRGITRKDVLKAAWGNGGGLHAGGAWHRERVVGRRRRCRVRSRRRGGDRRGGRVQIDIDLAGTKRDLRDEGWDVDPGENHPTARIFVQSGSIRRDIVEVEGRVIFANDPENFGALVKTRATAETGLIDWDFGGFLFTGTGRVIVAEAELESED
jgi:hypothetical protein